MIIVDPKSTYIGDRWKRINFSSDEYDDTILFFTTNLFSSPPTNASGKISRETKPTTLSFIFLWILSLTTKRSSVYLKFRLNHPFWNR